MTDTTPPGLKGDHALQMMGDLLKRALPASVEIGNAMPELFPTKPTSTTDAAIDVTAVTFWALSLWHRSIAPITADSRQWMDVMITVAARSLSALPPVARGPAPPVPGGRAASRRAETVARGLQGWASASLLPLPTIVTAALITALECCRRRVAPLDEATIAWLTSILDDQVELIVAQSGTKPGTV